MLIKHYRSFLRARWNIRTSLRSNWHWNPSQSTSPSVFWVQTCYRKTRCLSTTFIKHHVKAINCKLSLAHLSPIAMTAPYLESTDGSSLKRAFRPYVVLCDSSHWPERYDMLNLYSAHVLLCAPPPNKTTIQNPQIIPINHEKLSYDRKGNRHCQHNIGDRGCSCEEHIA